ncbi:DDE-type integrase/transposase/recombinase [Escherichia coli]|nr:DDE-type integrase/transposase/recombinase [Escherichia coli]HAL9104039.1 DDE-type integrase/transposase/recombinase [Escherichia coli]HAL9410289.1 DDE-type integrase/transposase/recombinase [Escherichia coli]HAL9429562.1 DDE-type integrase/transposase/recombinase [Escherichia coli]
MKRQFYADRPNQKWVTDVTEFKVDGRKLYLSPIMDLYNGEIVSYNLTERPLASMVKSMLLDAVEQLNKDDKPLCCGQLKLATALEFFQYRFSDSFGGNPPLYSCGLSAL